MFGKINKIISDSVLLQFLLMILWTEILAIVVTEVGLYFIEK
jgi:hypothetical protein